MTAILGLNAYHGVAAAAPVVDNEFVAAVDEDRFNRIKHWAGFPSGSIRWSLQDAGLEAKDLDHVNISFDPRARMMRRLGFLAKHRPSLGAIKVLLKRQQKTLGFKEQFVEALRWDVSSARAEIHGIGDHGSEGAWPQR
ncbi:hypothetical protein OAF73_00210 [Planctomycetota bacterium]|nr:hypothetical protein [Planctomycetota bacterium]